MSALRIDKYLADMGIGTRSEIKNMARKGLISVNGEVVKKSDMKVNPGEDTIAVAGKKVGYADFEYYMLNKPAGVVSATEDKVHETVVDLIIDKMRKDLFPVGRLDIDTEGLLLITNDGQLAHDLLSPKKHVAKTYYAKVAGRVEKEHVEKFKTGVDIGEEKDTLPAELVVLKKGDVSEIEITIMEGKFHQIKRMFEAIGMEVLYLRRISMGILKLDENLELGEYRPLTSEELEGLRKN